MHETPDDRSENAVLMPRSDIPLTTPVSTEEVERRRKVVERMLRLRERIGPIGIRADDLLHASRSESER